MADASFTQSNFLGGEVSPLWQGRIDDPRYRTSMNVCFNAVLSETGAWMRRSGTRFIAPTPAGGPARVIKFDFEANAPYQMEFSDTTLRFINGTRLANTSDSRTITAINTDTPAIVTTDADHGWSTGDQAYAIGCDPLLLNRTLSINVTATNAFGVTDAVTGEALSGLSLTSGAGGTISRIQKITTPYSTGLWSSIRSIQAETSATLLHPSISPYIVTITSEPDEDSDAQIALSQVRFLDGPYLDPVLGGAVVTPNAKKGTITLTISFPTYDSAKAYSLGDFVFYSAVNYQSLTDQNVGNQPDTHTDNWVAVDPGIAVGPDGLTSADVGRPIRLFSEPAAWDSSATYGFKAVVKYNDVYWSSAAASNTGNLPGSDVTKWAVNPNGALWSWGKITGSGNVISPSTGAPIGSMTSQGGLGAAFDGDTTQSAANAARYNIRQTFTLGAVSISAFVGKDFHSSAQKMSGVTIYPSSDKGICFTNSPFLTLTSVTLNLRASNTLPTTPSAGVKFGTKTSAASFARPVAIGSSNQTTAFKYIWVEVVATFEASIVDTSTQSIAVAELQIHTPSGGSSSSFTVQVLGDDLLYTTPVSVWRLGAYSDSLGWPTCGTYHEGRIWLSGAIGNRIDACVPGDVNSGKLNFAPTAPDGTVTDASGITYTFDAPDVNPVYWMEPDQQGIICGTKAGEWLVQASALNNPLTALNIQAHRVTRIGCANIEPRRTEHTLVFVQKYARKVMEYFADVFSGKFTAPNLHERAKHLTLPGIQELAYQQELSPIIWTLLADGSLIGGSYKRDTLMTSQGPTFMGWHRHTHGAGRNLESICIGGNADGTLDTLAMVTANDAGIRHLELLTNLPDESTTLQNGWFVDGGIVPATSTVTVNGTPHFRCAGLWPYEGETVSIFAGGYDLGDYLVASGRVDVPFAADADRQFTQAYVAAYSGTMPVLAGFTFTSDGQIVRPATMQESGSRNGPALGKKRRAFHYAMLLQTTKGLKVGTSFDKLKPAIFKTQPDGGAALTALQAKSGIHWQELNDDHGFDSALCWRIERPYPGAIAAVTEMLDTKDQ